MTQQDVLVPIKLIYVQGTKQEAIANLSFEGFEAWTTDDDPSVGERTLHLVLPNPPPETTVVSVPSGAGFASASGAFSSEGPGTVRVRFQMLNPPSTGFHWIAGFTAAASQGWLVATQETGIGSAFGQLVVYAGLDGTLTRIGRKFLLAAQIGEIVTVHIVFDGTHAHVYVDGYEIGVGNVTTGMPTAYTAYNKATSTALGVGNDATHAFVGEQGIIEVATSSLAMSAAQVLADAQKAVGVAMANETHRYTASAGLGSTWDDADGAVSLTKTGNVSVSTSLLAVPSRARTFNARGDSITAGYQAGNTSGDGWRRGVQVACHRAGVRLAFQGENVPNGATALDYDYWNDGNPGEQLQDRLPTFATDLANTGTATTGVILAYGINDLIAGDRTSAELVADIATACADIRSARPGAPIVIVNIFDVASGAATSGQHAEIATYIAQFGAMVTALKGAGYNVAGADVSGVTGGDPDSTAVLWDGVHPTPPTYAAMATIIADALMTLV